MKKNDPFLFYLLSSIALHGVVLFLFIFNFHISQDLRESPVIVFQTLPLGDIVNIENKSIQKEPTVENEDAKKVERSKKDDIPAEEEKPIENKPEEKPLEDNVPKEIIPDKSPEKKVEEKPKEQEVKKPEAKPLKKEEKKEEKKKAEKPKKKLPTKSDLDNLLKNLEKESDGKNAKSSKQNRKQNTTSETESQGPYNENNKLSVTESALIKKQIEDNWNKPMDLGDLDGIYITVTITLAQDGVVQGADVLDAVCGNISKSRCQAIIDSALRAVRDTSPVQGLDPARYDRWKTFNFHFIPSSI